MESKLCYPNFSKDPYIATNFFLSLYISKQDFNIFWIILHQTSIRSVLSMLAITNTLALTGIEAKPVKVEVDIQNGLPGFEIVGY